jgi:hypothetical protein
MFSLLSHGAMPDYCSTSGTSPQPHTAPYHIFHPSFVVFAVARAYAGARVACNDGWLACSSAGCLIGQVQLKTPEQTHVQQLASTPAPGIPPQVQKLAPSQMGTQGRRPLPPSPWNGSSQAQGIVRCRHATGTRT